MKKILLIALISFTCGMIFSYFFFYQSIYNQSRFDIFESKASDCDKNPENVVYKIPEITNSYYSKFIDFKDVGYVTPLYLAMRGGCYKDMDSMLKNGANPNQIIYGEPLREIAVRYDKKEAIDLIDKYKNNQ